MRTPPTRAQAPSRWLEQRREALRRANEIRSERAKLKRKLRAGTVCLEETLADPPEWILGAEVSELLLAVAKVGPAKVARLLRESRIGEAKTVGGLSERQRQDLRAALIGHRQRRGLNRGPVRSRPRPPMAP